MAIDTGIPAQLVAGDGWAWSDAIAYASHPPPDWALHYVLRPVAGGTPITIVATWVGDEYRLTRSATDSASDAPGDYAWTALAIHMATVTGPRWARAGCASCPTPRKRWAICAAPPSASWPPSTPQSRGG